MSWETYELRSEGGGCCGEIHVVVFQTCDDIRKKKLICTFSNYSNR